LVAQGAATQSPDPLPAILLGQLAVDLRWQGQGIARSLMFYALTTAVRLSEQVGCFCVLTHPLDDDVRALYAAFGFEDLPFDPGAAWRFGSRIWFAAALGQLTELASPGSLTSMRRDEPLRWQPDRTRMVAVGGL
jgi:predicted N-acetyltransferase YhbS